MAITIKGGADAQRPRSASSAHWWFVPWRHCRGRESQHPQGSRANHQPSYDHTEPQQGSWDRQRSFRHVVHFGRDCVVLRWDSGVDAAVHKVAYENEDGSHYVAYPLELGFACTLAKVQGGTLNHLAIYPDVAVPGGGYVAVTRVKNHRHVSCVERHTEYTGHEHLYLGSITISFCEIH